MLVFGTYVASPYLVGLEVELRLGPALSDGRGGGERRALDGVVVGEAHSEARRGLVLEQDRQLAAHLLEHVGHIRGGKHCEGEFAHRSVYAHLARGGLAREGLVWGERPLGKRVVAGGRRGRDAPRAAPSEVGPRRSTTHAPRQARGLGRRAVVAAAGCPGARVCGGGKSSVVVDLTVVGQCGRGALRAEQLPEESATTLTSRRSRDSIGWAASSVGLGKPSAAPPRAAPHGRQNRGRNQKGRRGHRK